MQIFHHRAGIAILVFAIALAVNHLPAGAQQSAILNGDVLCTPRLQMRQSQRCAQEGPAADVSAMARKGLLSQVPLPIEPFDPSLSFVPFNYARVGEDGATLYGSPQAAAKGGGGGERISSGFVFLSYFDEIDQGGTKVYSTARGYVSGRSASPIDPLNFHGLTFSRTPSRAFAFIVSGGTCSQRTPGGPEDYSGTCYTRFSVVQVYDVERVGDWDWYQIGQDEWIEQRLLAVVTPDLTKPPGVEDDRWITVNLYEQTVTAYEGGEMVFATTVSTGRNGFWTQPGTFQVWAKLERDDMTGGLPEPDGGYYYLEDVPWVLYFDQARALHGTYWHARFGTPTSRGCVNLTPADAHWLFEFAQEGTYVYVVDPSGQTPTDPDLYGAGGA